MIEDLYKNCVTCVTISSKPLQREEANLRRISLICH
jgi:hypothetical protein